MATATIDGITTSGSRVLLTAQADPTQNGIWDTSTADWTRSADCDGTYDLACGSMVMIAQGSHAFQLWALTTANPVSIGTSALAWSQNTSMAFLATLAGGSGAALVGFQEPASSSVRTSQDKMREINVSAAGYPGFDATKATVSDAAIQAAVDEVHALGGGVVQIPPCLVGTVLLRDNVHIYIKGGDVVTQKQPTTAAITGFVKPAGNLSNVRFFGGGRIDGARAATSASPSNTAIYIPILDGETV